jgi:hypothetical protein
MAILLQVVKREGWLAVFGRTGVAAVMVQLLLVAAMK